jgi:hypothetical protein
LRGGKVLLLGDSLLDCHEGENRIEHPMREKLGALRPGVAWEVVDLARGGIWIGPADATAVEGVAAKRHWNRPCRLGPPRWPGSADLGGSITA